MQFSPFRQHNLQNTKSQGSNSNQIYPTSKYYNFQSNLIKNRLFENNYDQCQNDKIYNKENKNTISSQKIINKNTKKDFSKKNYNQKICSSSRGYDLKRQQKRLNLRNQKKNSKKCQKSMSIMMQNDSKRVLLQQQLRHYIKLSSVLRKRNEQLQKRNAKQNAQYKKQIKEMKDKVKSLYERAQKKQKVHQTNNHKFLEQKYPTIKFNDKIDFKYGKKSKQSGKKSVRITSKVQNQCLQSEIKNNQASQYIKYRQISELFDNEIQKTLGSQNQYYQFFKTFTKSLQIFKMKPKTLNTLSFLKSYQDQSKKYKDLSIRQAKQIWLQMVQFLIKHNFYCKN